MQLSDDAISTIRDLIDFVEFYECDPATQYATRSKGGGMVRTADVIRLREEILRYEQAIIKEKS